jgi:hypothetical protein
LGHSGCCSQFKQGAVFFRIQEDSDASAHGLSLLLLDSSLFNFTRFGFLVPTYLIDALFTVLSPELQEQAIAHLCPDTQQTVKQILAPAPIVESTQATAAQTVSVAKQAQTWSELWRDWDALVWQASQEQGKYIAQEAHWEPPYFDTTTFTEDLESVVGKMLPLLQTAFEHEFTPDRDFAAALLEAEAEVSGGIPDWIEITDGLYIERQLTHCVLQWEWLLVQEQGQDAFDFAQRIRQYERQFREVKLNSHPIQSG